MSMRYHVKVETEAEVASDLCGKAVVSDLEKTLYSQTCLPPLTLTLLPRHWCC